MSLPTCTFNVPGVRNYVPNQRSKDKTYLGGFVDRKLHAQLMRLAKQAGMEDNRFGFVTQLLQESLKRRKRRKHQKRFLQAA
jgi:hypothetical protein